MNIRHCFIGMIFFSLICSFTFGQTGVPSIYLKFRTDKVYLLEGQQVEIIADVYVGTWETPVRNLYAASLDVIFPADIVLADLTTFTYDVSAFLGKKNEVTTLNKAPEALKEGRLNFLLSRTDGKGMSGFGKVGEVHFITIHDIIDSRNLEETPFNIHLENVELLDPLGNEIPNETDAEGATIIIVNDILARQSRQNNLRQVEIYPNPARDLLIINLQNIRGERLELFNAAGQRVLRDQVKRDQVQISTTDLRPGFYTLKIHSEEGVITRRILVQ